jgi:hypothetical protein
MKAIVTNISPVSQRSTPAGLIGQSPKGKEETVEEIPQDSVKRHPRFNLSQCKYIVENLPEFSPASACSQYVIFYDAYDMTFHLKFGNDAAKINMGKKSEDYTVIPVATGLVIKGGIACGNKLLDLYPVDDAHDLCSEFVIPLLKKQVLAEKVTVTTEMDEGLMISFKEVPRIPLMGVLIFNPYRTSLPSEVRRSNEIIMKFYKKDGRQPQSQKEFHDSQALRVI